MNFRVVRWADSGRSDRPTEKFPSRRRFNAEKQKPTQDRTGVPYGALGRRFRGADDGTRAGKRDRKGRSTKRRSFRIGRTCVSAGPAIVCKLDDEHIARSRRKLNQDRKTLPRNWSSPDIEKRSASSRCPVRTTGRKARHALDNAEKSPHAKYSDIVSWSVMINLGPKKAGSF